MYTHEVIGETPRDCAQIEHYRGQTLDSGLVAMIALGHTVAVPLEMPYAGHHSNLIIANSREIEMYGLARTDTRSDSLGRIPDRVLNNDSLEEFVASGKAAWQDMVNRLGYAVSVQLHLNEQRQDVETVSPFGIILPHESYSDFASYVATPDEIEAMERITDSMVPQDLVASAGTRYGMYL